MSSKAKNSDGNNMLLIGGVALGLYGLSTLSKKNGSTSDQEQHTISENIADGVYAFVNNPSGTYMFARTANASEPLYGHGREPLASKLANGTYIGKLTGITFEELAQVQTNVDNGDVFFWVRKEDMRTAKSADFSLQSVLNKTQADLRNLVHTLIDKIRF